MSSINGFVFGVHDRSLGSQILMIKTPHHPFVRLLVLGFFSDDDKCGAAICLPL